MADKASKPEDLISAPSQAATGALAQLEAQIRQTGEAMRELAAAQQVAAASGDIAAYQAATAGLQSTTQAAVQAQQAYVAFGGAARDAQALASGGQTEAEVKATKDLAAAKKEAAAAAREAATAEQAQGAAGRQASADTREMRRGLGDAAREFQALGGPVGGAISHLLRFGKTASRLGPEVTAAIIVIAIAAIVVAGGIALMVAAISKGLSESGEARDQFLKLQGSIAAVSISTTKATDSVSALSKIIQSVASSSALGRDKIDGYAVALEQAGLRGEELKRALQAMADAGSAGGDEAAQKFLKEAQAARAAGQSVDALAKKYEKAFGATARAQALSLDVQFRKMKEDLSALFSGADISGFLAGLHQITSMFSQQTVIGRELKAILSSALTGFFDAAKAVFPYVKQFIIGLLIGAVEIYIIFKQIQAALAPAFATLGAVVGHISLVKAGTYLLLGAFGALVAILAVVAIAMFIAFSPIIVAIAIVIASMYAMYVAVSAIIDAFSAVGSAISGFFSSLDISGAASSLIDGFISGVTGSIGKVVAAMSSLGGAAKSALFSVLGIASPSRVAMSAAKNVTGTFADTMDDGAGDVKESLGPMTDPKSVKASAKGALASGAAKIVYIEKLIVDSAERLSDLRAMLRSEFAIEDLGGEPEPA